MIGVAITGLHVEVGGGAASKAAGLLDGLELRALGTLRVEKALSDHVSASCDHAPEVRVGRGVPRREVGHLRRPPEERRLLRGCGVRHGAPNRTASAERERRSGEGDCRTSYQRHSYRERDRILAV